MAARTPRTLGITAASQLVGISVPLMVYRVRTGKVRVYRRKPILIRTSELLDNLEALRFKHPQGRPLGSCKTTQTLENILT